MCLYPKLIKNKKYLPNKKNNWNPPKCEDYRVLYVTAACGKCLECRKQKQREWLVRMSEELRHYPNAYFMTLTFSEEKLEKYKKLCNSEDPNTIATKAIHLMLERCRRKLKHSVKHWFITELGHNGTERMHLHGLVWGIGMDKLVEEKWQNGIVYTGTFVNEKTINYITKYITKTDECHKEFIGQILCSPGIGRGYTQRADANKHVYKKGETIETYRLKNGAKINLPTYYKNKLFTEEEREKLWIDKIEKGIVWVMGQKVKIDNTEEYEALLEQARHDAIRLQGHQEQNWDKQKYFKRLERQRKKQQEELRKWENHMFQSTEECPF